MQGSPIERYFARDRWVIVTVLTALTILCWMQMVPSHVEGSHSLMPCCGATFSTAFWMWVVMMAGMMIPSVSPMVLAHAAIMRRRTGRGAPFVSSALFLGGYLLAWSGFGFVAAGAQWLLYRIALLDGRSLSVGPWAGAVVLVAAGLFQFSTQKNACLSQCRAPVGYFMTEWREGRLGAVKMGLHHGTYCIGCCWLLMAVLFSTGIMNLLWGAVITAFTIGEKVLPWPRLVVGIGGLGCFAGAAVLVGRALIGA